jgi:hypothetical protein
LSKQEILWRFDSAASAAASCGSVNAFLAVFSKEGIYREMDTQESKKSRDMSKEKNFVSFEEAASEVEVAMTRLALLHLSFSETLVRELGEEKGRQLIITSILEYGKRVGKRIKRGLPDLPRYGVYGKYADGKIYDCVLARIFREYGEEDLGCLYCYVDAAKTMAVDRNRKLIHKDCAACGDDYCTFEEAPTTAKERVDFDDMAIGWKNIDRRIAEEDRSKKAGRSEERPKI